MQNKTNSKTLQPVFDIDLMRFERLMQNRIHKILLVCSEYDYFSLNVDGRIEEQIFKEYQQLNLSYSPRIIHVETAEEALKEAEFAYIDLVITMLNVGEKFDAFEFAKKIKKKIQTPVVLLTPFSRQVSLRIGSEDLSGTEQVFSWLGSVDVLLAIIKLQEDKLNIDNDIKVSGVQTILLIEDSIRYYSGYLTNMYKILLTQSKKFMAEGLNEQQKMVRMRGRPKILLATNFEEALDCYEKYKDNILGIISDVEFPINGHLKKDAGFRFVKKVKADNKYLPIMLQSSKIKNKTRAKEMKVVFMHKLSKNLNHELKNFMNEYFAFGDFKFKDPGTKKIIAYARNLKCLEKTIAKVPDASFEYHLKRNHFSKWLNARALFPIAKYFKPLTLESFDGDLSELREFIRKAIREFRKAKSRGIIATFDSDKYDESIIFTRIGSGSIGGKARGLAFLDALIKKIPDMDIFKDVTIKIPQTVAISTELFDEYIESNNLTEIALSDASNEEILEAFIKAELPYSLKHDLLAYLRVTKYPIAIRSSSVLEDSHYQPFAGVYSTFMIANTAPDIIVNLTQLEQAIKSVYASVYYKETKAYMIATRNLIDDEKMGVVLQEVCGNKYGDRLYPTFSGVARSVNFYPIGEEKAEEGIVNVALGLGKHIVEGKKSIRFSPKYPKKILQLSTPEMSLRESQKTFYAVDLDYQNFKPSTNDGINIKTLRIKQADKDKSIYDISSVYDFQNNILREGKIYEGKRIITFANVLKYNSIRFSEIILEIMRVCEKAMNNPVEIEFAVNLEPQDQSDKLINILQIRPIVEETSDFDVSVEGVKDNDTVIMSNSVLGHGITQNICDIVYVKPDSFDSTNNQKIANMIEEINIKLVNENRNYILVGPGRWGSSDTWLGIPVVWSQISGAILIVESGLEEYRIEPSQGTHFFQNLTSFRVGYFTINPYKNDGFYNLDFLTKQKPVFENDFVRHVRFDKELLIKIDSKSGKGIVLKPEK